LRGTKRINLFDGSLPEPLEAARPKVNHQTFGGQPSKAKVANKLLPVAKAKFCYISKNPFSAHLLRVFNDLPV
jgi:hypothetical protein